MTRLPALILLLNLLWALAAIPALAQEITWRNLLRLTNSPYLTNHAEMAESAGIIHVVCTDEWSYGEIGAYYYHSLDGGLSFSQGTRLDNTPSAWAQLPAVAARGQTVHVVYEEHPDIGADVHIAYRRSTDGGVHWDSTQILNSNAIHPRVSCQGDSVYVIYNFWQEPRHSLFRYSYNEGSTWSPETQLYPECVYPDLVACDSQVFIAYQHYTYPINEIYLRWSLNGGQSWEDPMQVSLSAGIPSQWPHIAVGTGGFLAVSWFDHENAPPGFTGWIHMRTSPDYGQNLDSVQVISTTPYCTDNDIAVCDGTIHAAYMDEREGLDHRDVYYRRGLNDGSSWDEEVQLNNDSGWSQYPSLAAVPSWVYVVWETHDSTGYDLYFIAGDEGVLGVNSPSKPPPVTTNLQVFPNPANPVTWVSYHLPAPQKATLAVYNLLGQKVATLAQGLQPPRTHTYLWNAAGFASGVYVVRLEVEDNQQVEKVVVLR